MIDILNTPFAIWLLSSVVVGSVTFFYKKFSVRVDERRTQTELAERIDAEISWRLYNTRAFINSHDINDTSAFMNAVGHLTKTHNSYLYERFEGMSLDKLIFTLYQTREDTRPHELLHVLDQLQAIKNVPHASRSSAKETAGEEEKQLLNKFMEDEITRKRWGTLRSIST